MKNQLVITIALAAAFSTGCDLKLQDQLGGEEQPEVEQPIDRERPPMEGGVEPPTGEGEPPVDPPEHGEDGIEHPIEEVEPPLDAPEDGGDAPEGFDVDDPEGGDVNGGGHPGAHGDDEEGDEDEGEWVFGEECEPGAGACEDGATCEETCEPSYCDADGRCTMDCHIVFRCAERVQ